ncbi:hypothetical protein ACO0QE_000738 [Hanseniaspora vineae]
MAGLIVFGVLQVIVLLKTEREKRKERNYLRNRDENDYDSDNENESILMPESGGDGISGWRQRRKERRLAKKKRNLDRMAQINSRRTRRTRGGEEEVRNPAASGTDTSGLYTHIDTADPPPPYSA